MDSPDVLVMTTLDAPTYQTYAQLAAVARASTPAVLRHTLSGIAPTLAAATSRIAPGQPTQSLHLYAALTYGDLVLGGESRCALSAEAVSVHAHVAATVARAQALLERSQATYAAAVAALAAARTPQAGRTTAPRSCARVVLRARAATGGQRRSGGRRPVPAPAPGDSTETTGGRAGAGRVGAVAAPHRS